MNKRILLVDDEPDIIEFLQYNLVREGFEVISAKDGIEALRKISEKPDLIILDIMMPNMDGFEVCKKIRSKESLKNIPIIFLTAKSSEVDEIAGLELGANDYVKKPISPKKLIARVNSNLRKLDAAGKEKEENEIVTIGPLVIDKEKYIVNLNSEEMIFPRKEFELLYFLARNPGKVYSRESLLKEVWGIDIYVIDRTIDVHIRKIREKLGKHSDLIETVKGVGYKFKVFK
jgi:two-component system, OmpR family, alkaline phosphatase synthesis response regulator PhoP